MRVRILPSFTQPRDDFEGPRVPRALLFVQLVPLGHAILTGAFARLPEALAER